MAYWQRFVCSHYTSLPGYAQGFGPGYGNVHLPAAELLQEPATFYI